MQARELYAAENPPRYRNVSWILIFPRVLHFGSRLGHLWRTFFKLGLFVACVGCRLSGHWFSCSLPGCSFSIRANVSGRKAIKAFSLCESGPGSVTRRLHYWLASTCIWHDQLAACQPKRAAFQKFCDLNLKHDVVWRSLRVGSFSECQQEHT